MLKRYKAIGAVLIAIVVFTIAAVAPAAAGTYGGWTYVVVRGDTLANIAGRYHTTVSALMYANPYIYNPNVIYAGQAIIIPAPAYHPPAPPPPAYHHPPPPPVYYPPPPPPVYYPPAPPPPVYYPPAHGYYPPAPGYYQPAPCYYQQAPCYYQPAPGYVPPGTPGYPWYGWPPSTYPAPAPAWGGTYLYN